MAQHHNRINSPQMKGKSEKIIITIIESYLNTLSIFDNYLGILNTKVPLYITALPGPPATEDQ
jgi:hypothetical protein